MRKYIEHLHIYIFVSALVEDLIVSLRGDRLRPGRVYLSPDTSTTVCILGTVDLFSAF